MNYPLVRDMPVPAEYAPYFVDLDKNNFGRTPQEKQMIADRYKLDYLYPGRAVVCVETKDGLAVVADTEVGLGHARRIMDNLPSGLRESSQILFPELW